MFKKLYIKFDKNIHRLGYNSYLSKSILKKIAILKMSGLNLEAFKKNSH